MGLFEGHEPAAITLEHPTGALVFHAQHATVRHGAITYHPIDSGADGSSILPGRPMTAADARGLLQALLGDRTGELHWLPERLLAMGDESLAWFVPGRVRPMLFRGEKNRTIRLEVPWPTLVFAATDGAIRLAAIKSRGRPTHRTPLYHAPLWNVSRDGQVCLGSATVPHLEGAAVIPDYESAIFDTLFSHANFRGNLRYRQNADGSTEDRHHIAFWRELAETKPSRFPHEMLVPMGLRLGRFLGLDGAPT